MSTNRNPADVVSRRRIGRLDSYRNVQDEILNEKLGNEFLPSYIADLARKSHSLVATFQNDVRSTEPSPKLQREGPSAAATGAPPRRSSSTCSPLPASLPLSGGRTFPGCPKAAGRATTRNSKSLLKSALVDTKANASAAAARALGLVFSKESGG